MLQCFFIEMSADHDDLTGELRRALPYIGLTRYEVEVHPVTTVLRILKHTLAADDGAVGLTLGPLVKDGLELRLTKRMRGFHAPVREYFVRVMVMAAAVAVLVMLVVMVLVLLVIMVLILVIVVAAAVLVLIMIVVMVLVLLMIMVLIVMAVVAAVLVLVMLMLVIVIMVMVMMVMVIVMMVDGDAIIEGLDHIVIIVVLFLTLMCMDSFHDFLHHGLLEIILTGDDTDELLTAELCLWGRHDLCLRIDLLHDLHRSIDLLLGCNIGSRQHDGTCIENLVVKELAEVLRVELRLLCIHDGHRRIQLDIEVSGNRLHRTDDVRQLADTRRLDDDTIRLICLHNLLQRLLKITNQ